MLTHSSRSGGNTLVSLPSTLVWKPCACNISTRCSKFRCACAPVRRRRERAARRLWRLPPATHLRPPRLPLGPPRHRPGRLRSPPGLFRGRGDRHRRQVPPLRRLPARCLRGLAPPTPRHPRPIRPSAEAIHRLISAGHPGASLVRFTVRRGVGSSRGQAGAPSGPLTPRGHPALNTTKSLRD